MMLSACQVPCKLPPVGVITKAGFPAFFLNSILLFAASYEIVQPPGKATTLPGAIDTPSYMESVDPNCVLAKIDKGALKRAKLLRGRNAPKTAVSNTDNVGPKLFLLRRDRDKPRLTQSGTDKVELKRTTPNTDNEAPQGIVCRNESGL